MAPKRQNASSSTPQKPSSSLQSTSTSSTSAPSSSLTSAFTPTKPSSTSSSSNAASIGDAQEILNDLWRNYLKETPQRVKLIDVFMGFLVAVGVLQFVYAVVGGNYVSACSHFFSISAKGGKDERGRCAWGRCGCCAETGMTGPRSGLSRRRSTEMMR